MCLIGWKVEEFEMGWVYYFSKMCIDRVRGCNILLYSEDELLIV